MGYPMRVCGTEYVWLILLGAELCGCGSGCNSGCGGPEGPQKAAEKARVREPAAVQAKGAAIATLQQAQEALAENRYPQAMAYYLAQQLDQNPDQLLERARLLAEAGEFYQHLAVFAAEIRRDLHRLWEERQQEGEMRSSMLACFAAMGAYEQGAFARSAAMLERLQQEQVPEALERRARVAIGASYIRMGKAEEGRRLIQEVAAYGAEDPGLALMSYRTQVEVGEIPPGSQNPSWERAEIADPGLRNAALVDLAWLRLSEGKAREAYQLLQSYQPHQALAEEEIQNKNQAEKFSRKHYGIAFLPLLARTCYRLAAADLELLAGEQGDRGLYAQYLLGKALQGAEQWAAAETAYARFIAGLEKQPAGGYLQYLGRLARVYRGRALAEQGQQDQAAKIWEQLGEGETWADLAVKFTLLEEQCKGTGAQPDFRVLDLVYARMCKVRPQQLSDEDYDYYHHAGMQAAQLLVRGPKERKDQAADILERVHDKSNGYDPKKVEPSFLLNMARVYYLDTKIQWSLGKKIIGALVAQYPECTPALEIYGYLLADFGGDAPENTIPGSGGQ